MRVEGHPVARVPKSKNAMGQRFPACAWVLLGLLGLFLVDGLGLGLLPGVTSAGAHAGRKHRPKVLFKVATVAPEGTTWMKLMHEMDERVRAETGGEVGFKFYAGGSQGSDLDVLRKIRTGQIHGAGLTGVGLGEIEPSLRIMELPFMFRNADEVTLAHQHLDPIFEKRVRDRGFEILGWAEVGFVNLFSQSPVASVADVNPMRMWLWEGDPLAKALLEAFGVSPVPLNVTDVLTSLQTGIINTVYATPYTCLSLQWFTRVKYMTDVPITYAIGAVLLSKGAFDKLSSEQAATLRRIADEIFDRLIVATRAQNVESADVIAERNITRVSVAPADIKGFEAIGRQVWQQLTGVLYDRALLDKLTTALEQSR
ncbi:MAG: TRAP transporter substrate-binding protein DctP [Candidatus Eisenbacteria sp.]|nr:TRAP transporter substrate-binding protein DctP [Candidatus Eisenbacteria bacterium]